MPKQLFSKTIYQSDSLYDFPASRVDADISCSIPRVEGTNDGASPTKRPALLPERLPELTAFRAPPGVIFTHGLVISSSNPPLLTRLSGPWGGDVVVVEASGPADSGLFIRKNKKIRKLSYRRLLLSLQKKTVRLSLINNYCTIIKLLDNQTHTVK